MKKQIISSQKFVGFVLRWGEIAEVHIVERTHPSAHVLHVGYAGVCWPTRLGLGHQATHLELFRDQVLVGLVEASSDHFRGGRVWILAVRLGESSNEKLVLEPFWFLGLARVVPLGWGQVTLSEIFLLLEEQLIEPFNHEIILVMSPALRQHPVTSLDLMWP